jgi:aminocarboxymuconate-semialdehyde decarboxylase
VLPRVLDIHAHFYPQSLPDFAARTNDSRWPALESADAGRSARIAQNNRVVRVIDDSYFALDARLDRLAELGVGHQILSPLPLLIPHWAEARQAADWCRAVNDKIADVAASAKGLSAMGILPVQDRDAALQELDRILERKMCGVELGTAVSSQQMPADPAISAVLAAVAAVNLPVLVHPTRGTVLEMPQFESSLGILTDTAAAVAPLLLERSAERPKMCLAHGGGTLLWAWHRIALQNKLDSELPDWLYVDTAGCTPHHVRFLTDLLGPARVVFGSDLPAASDMQVYSAITTAIESGYAEDLLRAGQGFLQHGPDWDGPE